jgi:uncharacterized membrane protein
MATPRRLALALAEATTEAFSHSSAPCARATTRGRIAPDAREDARRAVVFTATAVVAVIVVVVVIALVMMTDGRRAVVALGMPTNGRRHNAPLSTTPRRARGRDG